MRDGLRVGRESASRGAKRSEPAQIASSGVAAVELGRGEDEAALLVDAACSRIDAAEDGVSQDIAAADALRLIAQTESGAAAALSGANRTLRPHEHVI